MKTRLLPAFTALVVLAAMSACTTLEAPREASLFSRLGGKSAIDAVVNDFVDTVRADKRITNQKVANRMETIDVGRLKSLVAEMVCEGTGGPCKYSGRPMKETHQGLGISEADFNYVVDDLVKTLDKYEVPEKEKNELLAILGPMQPDIVEAR